MDASPGRAGEFEVDEGSSTDRSDLEALSVANAGGSGRLVGAHAAGRRPDGDDPRLGGRALHRVTGTATRSRRARCTRTTTTCTAILQAASPSIASGTDQTWLERSAFGVYGDGVLMRGCVADATCRQLYVDALHAIGASPAVAALPAQARAIRAAIAPWRARDTRREQTVAVGEAQADSRDRDHRRPTGGAGRMARGPFVRRCRSAVVTRCRRRRRRFE